MTDIKFDKRVAIVTGAGVGIGQYYAFMTLATKGTAAGGLNHVPGI